MKKIILILTALTAFTNAIIAQNFEQAQSKIVAHISEFIDGSRSMPFRSDFLENNQDSVIFLFNETFENRKNFRSDVMFQNEKNYKEIWQQMSQHRMKAFENWNNLFYANIEGVSDGMEGREVDKQVMINFMTLSMLSGDLQDFFLAQAKVKAAGESWYDYPIQYSAVTLLEILFILDESLVYDRWRKARPIDNKKTAKEITEKVIIKLTELKTYLSDIIQSGQRDPWSSNQGGIDDEPIIVFINSLMKEMTPF